MAINKVIYGGRTLIDLTTDTVTASALSKGVTAHDKRGVLITGTNAASERDEIDRILECGLSDLGTRTSSRSITITVSDDGNTVVKTAKNGSTQVGKTTTVYTNDARTITTTDSKGRKLVRNFTSDMLSCTSIFYNTSGTEVARLVKTYSSNGDTLTSKTTYR